MTTLRNVWKQWEQASGEFTFVYYDRHQRRLLFARDKLGRRSLLFAHDKTALYLFMRCAGSGTFAEFRQVTIDLRDSAKIPEPLCIGITCRIFRAIYFLSISEDNSMHTKRRR